MNRVRVSTGLVLALLLPSFTRAQAVTRARDTTLPAFGWAPFYFPSFDGAARATGLRPLRVTDLPPNQREVRIWTQVEIAIPKQLYRFVDRGGRVTGELIYYWPAPPPDTAKGEHRGETTDDLMRFYLRGRCDGFVVARKTGVCRARFARTPDWARVLDAAETHGLWSIPDPATLPPDGVMMTDGWTIVVELRDARGYKAYGYNNPDAHPKWAPAAQVSEIARVLGAVDSVIAPSDAVHLYRGLTTGRRQSAFRSCDGRGDWEFQDDLRDLTRHAPPHLRAVLPDSAADTIGTEQSRFYVEVLGELTPKWLARQWKSRFPRVLQVLELRDVRQWTGVDCPR